METLQSSDMYLKKVHTQNQNLEKKISKLGEEFQIIFPLLQFK